MKGNKNQEKKQILTSQAFNISKNDTDKSSKLIFEKKNFIFFVCFSRKNFSNYIKISNEIILKIQEMSSQRLIYFKNYMKRGKNYSKSLLKTYNFEFLIQKFQNFNYIFEKIHVINVYIKYNQQISTSLDTFKNIFYKLNSSNNFKYISCLQIIKNRFNTIRKKNNDLINKIKRQSITIENLLQVKDFSQVLPLIKNQIKEYSNNKYNYYLKIENSFVKVVLLKEYLEKTYTFEKFAKVLNIEGEGLVIPKNDVIKALAQDSKNYLLKMKLENSEKYYLFNRVELLKYIEVVENLTEKINLKNYLNGEIQSTNLLQFQIQNITFKEDQEKPIEDLKEKLRNILLSKRFLIDFGNRQLFSYHSILNILKSEKKGRFLALNYYSSKEEEIDKNSISFPKEIESKEYAEIIYKGEKFYVQKKELISKIENLKNFQIPIALQDYSKKEIVVRYNEIEINPFISDSYKLSSKFFDNIKLKKLPSIFEKKENKEGIFLFEEKNHLDSQSKFFYKKRIFFVRRAIIKVMGI